MEKEFERHERNALVQVDPFRYAYHENDPFEVGGMILSRIPENARVLDVGCGVGALAVLMKEIRGATVIGIEPQHDRAVAARLKGLEVLEGMLEPGMPELSDKFDAIVFADVLEHMDDPLMALQTAKEYLAENGKIIASIPNVAHWTIRWDLLRGRWDYADCGIMDSTHLRWFTKKTTLDVFERAGFRVVDYAVTAGTKLADYQMRKFFCWFSEKRRAPIIRSLARRMPTLFGCQHIVTATAIGSN